MGLPAERVSLNLVSGQKLLPCCNGRLFLSADKIRSTCTNQIRFDLQATE
jgi:hypothetical protein